MLEQKKQEVFYPNPFPWRLLGLQEVRQHRKQDCVFYDSCLNKAAIANYKGWTCLFCGFGKQVQKTPEVPTAQIPALFAN